MISFKTLKLKGMLIGLLLALLGCSSKSQYALEVIVPNQPETLVGVPPNSCDSSFAEGGEVDLSQLQSNQTEVTSFNKRFHGNILNTISFASAEETIKVLNSFNVSVYRGPGVSCRMFDKLPLVNGDLAKVWKSVNQSLPEDQVVLGLYMPTEIMQGGKVIQDPTIIIRQDTGRWTLIHEMMHFLFHKWEVDEGTSYIHLRGELSDVENETEIVYSAFQTSGRGLDFANFVELFGKYLKLNHEFIKRSSLEEATIEDTLANRYYSGRLKYVSENDVYNVWYLNSSLSEAQKHYVDFKEKLNNVVKKPQAEAIAYLESHIAELQVQIDVVIEDTEEAILNKTKLENQLALIKEEQLIWNNVTPRIEELDSFLSAVQLEIVKLYKKAKEHNNKDVDPFSLMTQISMSGLKLKGISQAPEKGTRGCSYIKMNRPSFSFLN